MKCFYTWLIEFSEGAAMPVKNTPNRYGWLSIALHWSMALAVIGMFALGLWMRELSYYDPWYKDGPALHKSIGIVLFGLLIVRTVWRNVNMRPNDDPALNVWERISAPLTPHSAVCFAVCADDLRLFDLDRRWPRH